MNWNTRNFVSVVEKGEKREKRKREKKGKGRAVCILPVHIRISYYIFLRQPFFLAFKIDFVSKIIKEKCVLN